MRRTTPVLLLALALVAVACQPSWTQPRGDLARSGHQSDAEAVTEAAVAGLTPLWSTPLGEVGSDPLVPSPVVARGTVVVPTWDALLAFPVDGSGCDPATGTCEPSWRGELPTGRTIFGALISGGVVLVVYGGVDGQGVALYSLEAGDHCTPSPVTCPPLATIPGEHLWTPVLADGRLYTVSALPLPTGGDALAVLGYDLVDCVDGDGCDPVWQGVGRGGELVTGVGAAPTVVGDHLWLVADLPLVWDLSETAGCTGSHPVVCEPTAVVDPGRTPYLSELLSGAVAAEGGLGVAASLDDTTQVRLEVFETSPGAACVGAPTATCPALGAAEIADVAYPRPALVGGVAYVAGEADDGARVVQAVDVARCATDPQTCSVATRWEGPPGTLYLAPVTVAGEAVLATSDQGPVAFARDPVGCGAEGDPCPPLWVAGTPGSLWSEVVVVGDLVLAVGGTPGDADAVDAALHVWRLPG